MNKTDYQKPTCEILVIRFEENIMSPKLGVAGRAGANDTYNSYDEDF